jgi:hypothetical protein
MTTKVISADSHIMEPPGLWASDYPRVESTWPHSQRVIERRFAEASEREKHKIPYAKAAKLYGVTLE